MFTYSLLSNFYVPDAPVGARYREEQTRSQAGSKGKHWNIQGQFPVKSTTVRVSREGTEVFFHLGQKCPVEHNMDRACSFMNSLAFH